MECAICKTEFMPTTWNNKYCNSKCLIIARDWAMELWKAEHSKERNAIIDMLKQEYDGCWYCGIKMNGYDIDHIISRSKGGPDSIENYALSCWRCNMAKQASSVDTFINWLEHIRSDRFNCYMKKQA